VIVGAGPAGSATACHLAALGHRVALLDKADFPRDKPCSEYLGPGAVTLLEQLNATETLRRRGARPLNGTTVVASRGSRLTGRFALASHQFPAAQGMSVSRLVLDNILLECAIAAGAEFFPHAAVEDLLAEGGQITGVQFRSGGRLFSIRGGVTVGADGIRSIVARRIGGMRRGRPARLGFVAHVRGVPGLSTLAEMHVGSSGYVGLNPLSEELTNVALVVPRQRGREASGRLDDFFFETIETFPGVRGRVDRALIAKPVLATGPFSITARRVIADGALLVGDAADFFDPFTGEGIYSALKGAEMASAAVNHALAIDHRVTKESLATYGRARRKAFRGNWAVERLIGYGMLAPALFDRAVGRLARTGNMAHTLIGVTADFLPARAVLNPVFLTRMVL
jgi:flavin-dependent dehydrogenase